MVNTCRLYFSLRNLYTEVEGCVGNHLLQGRTCYSGVSDAWGNSLLRSKLPRGPIAPEYMGQGTTYFRSPFTSLQAIMATKGCRWYVTSYTALSSFPVRTPMMESRVGAMQRTRLLIQYSMWCRNPSFQWSLLRNNLQPNFWLWGHAFRM